jgi:hypothetical protein
MIKNLILVAFITGAISARAMNREVSQVSDSAFSTLDPAAMDTSKIYYSGYEDLMPFDQWSKNEVQKEYLSLFDGYVEPTYNDRKENKQEKLLMFVGKAKAVINRPAASLDLKKMVSLNYAASLDPEIKHRAVNTAQLMPNVLDKSKAANFDWCNTPVMMENPQTHQKERDHGKDSISRPWRETDLTVLNPPNRPWCDRADRSICLESCYLFNSLWSMGVKGYNKLFVKKDDELKDYGVAFQSELRYFVSEAELGKKIPLSELTGSKGKVTGVIEQNMFYFNQIIQYGKVIAVFQELPGNKTLVTSFIAVGVRQRSIKKNVILKETIMGRNPALNSATGLTAGLPIFTQNLAKQIAAGLDQ